MRTILGTATCIVSALLVGCAHLPSAPSKADPRTVYVWPAAECPSAVQGRPGPRIAPVIAALATTMLGDVINGALGVPAGALNAAAAADKAGYQVSGVNARNYYHTVIHDTQFELASPGCYIVAYAKPSSLAKQWCDEADGFAKAVPDTCRNGREFLAGLSIRETAYGRDGNPLNDTDNSLAFLSVPEFYAEIQLDSSGYATVSRPRIVAMYYPQSLLAHDSTKPRMLTLGISLVTPLENDSFKAAQVAMILPSIVPASDLSAIQFKTAMVAWANVPKPQTINDQDALKKLFDSKSGYLPVTMTASIGEVGDPNVFLAAFAQAFSGSTGDLTKGMLAGINLGGGPSANSQAQSQAQANYFVALGAAQLSRSQLLAACVKAPLTSASDKANAESLFNATVGKQRAANVSAALAGVSLPFTSPDSVADVSPSCWQ